MFCIEASEAFDIRSSPKFLSLRRVCVFVVWCVCILYMSYFFCPVQSCQFSREAGHVGWKRKENYLTPHLNAHLADSTISSAEVEKAGYSICVACHKVVVPPKFKKRGTCTACTKIAEVPPILPSHQRR